MSRETGTIKSWRGRFGFIKPDGGGADLFFHANDTDLPESRLKSGTKVEYEVGQGRKGPVAQRVTLPGAAKEIPPKGYRFLNPYNFIRTLPRRNPSDSDDAAVKLLSFQPPPTHDRFLGLTGKIQCELETITPLFISGSEGVTQAKGDNGKTHNTYRFFRLNGEKAIPATSLRGMLRAAYEAVTNSPLSNFGGEQLSYRLESREVQKLVPGRVEKDAEGNWTLRLLPGDAPFAPDIGQKKGLYAAPTRFYKPLQKPRKQRGPSPEPIDRAKLEDDAENALQHGQEYFAVMRSVKFPPSWRVLALFDDEAEARRQLPRMQRDSHGGELKVQRGWMCITNQNADNKSNERFLFRDESEQRNVPERIGLPDKVCRDYEALIRDYQVRHADDVRKRKTPAKVEKGEIAYSRHVLDERERKLRGNELVFARIHGGARQARVEYIAPVSWPRVAYNNAIAELLPAFLHPETERSDALSPAARLFGWVDGRKGEEGAYAGRVRLTNGKLQQRGKQLDPQTLAILGTPKPTTTRFYLMPPDGKPKEGRSDIEVGYDGFGYVGKNKQRRLNQLRGRKAYRHFTERKHSTSAERTDQNRTVFDPEGEGARFTFEIAFENLAPVELGALLWTLTLGGKGYHRLGYAKPLGYGSVEIRPKSVQLQDFAARYSSLNGNATCHVSLDQQADLVRTFQKAFLRLYVPKFIGQLENLEAQGQSAIWGNTFEGLTHIGDMLAISSKTPPKLPVHYPFSPDPSSKGQFEWFMGNKRTNGLRLELGLPQNDQGLPLINKAGSQK